jgi:hypothetical protein
VLQPPCGRTRRLSAFRHATIPAFAVKWSCCWRIIATATPSPGAAAVTWPFVVNPNTDNGPDVRVRLGLTSLRAVSKTLRRPRLPRPQSFHRRSVPDTALRLLGSDPCEVLESVSRNAND